MSMADSLISKSVRVHDEEIYLKEDYINKPKEIFKFVYQHSEHLLAASKNLDILDIGCACGEYLFYMHEQNKNHNYYGMDVSSSMIERAKVQYLQQ